MNWFRKALGLCVHKWHPVRVERVPAGCVISHRCGLCGGKWVEKSLHRDPLAWTPVVKMSVWTWRDVYRLPLALALSPIVLRDYRLRRQHEAPDRWHWADVKLMQMGYGMRP